MPKTKPTPTDNAMGVSQWAEHGKEHGYWDYFEREVKKEAVRETLKVCEEAAESSLSLIMSELSGCDPTAEYLGEQVDTFKSDIGLTELRTEYGLDSKEGG